MRSFHLLMLVAATSAAVFAPSTSSAATTDVFVFDFAFSINRPGQGPEEDPTIFVGDTIRWVWLDEMHNTVACTGQAEFWESDIFMPGDTFVYTFTNVGTFNYYCAPHGADNGDGTAAGMCASIIVRPIPSPGTATLLVASTGLLIRRRRS